MERDEGIGDTATGVERDTEVVGKTITYNLKSKVIDPEGRVEGKPTVGGVEEPPCFWTVSGSPSG